MKANDCLRSLIALSLLVFGTATIGAPALAPGEKNLGEESGITREGAGSVSSGVEVNDKFMLISNKTGDASRLELIVLDGIRKSYPGDCQSHGPLPGIGVPRETRVIVEYGRANSSGKMEFSILRTLDFNGNMRKYQFSAEKGSVLILDKGVSFSLDSDGTLTYEQSVQPIGPAGRKAVSLRFDAIGDALSSAVVDLEADRWRFEPDGNANGFVINGVRGNGSITRDVAPIRNEMFDNADESNLRSMLANADKSADVSVTGQVIIYCFLAVCEIRSGEDPCKFAVAPFCDCISNRCQGQLHIP